MSVNRFLYCLVSAFLFFGCAKKPSSLFTSLPASHTGIYFENTISDNDSFNILDYLYYYNGGGVALGDINNDGLPDIYFTSNRGSNKLYLNKGQLQFKDITIEAGVQGKGNWKTGVTLADVNSDGFLDIYVSEVGGYKSLTGRNELFINNGLSPSPAREGVSAVTFTERANEYGLDIEGFNTQASFFDYDNDGDLDMFLANHSVHSTESYGSGTERNIHNEMSGDKLFRNDANGTLIKFTEVTQQAGIYSSALGYGLNVITADLDNDGWTDIYVSNDFHENDYYYINNRNGTFSEINQKAFGHESRFSMGSDIADLNNDGWNDIITLDMLPEDEKVLKSSTGDDPLDIYDYKMAQGYHHQYSKNCLQLNTGAGRSFSDIGLYAGIAATDWSWSPLAADFNNDGIKDLFISNGILRRPNDLDFLRFISNNTIAKDIRDNRSRDKLAISKMPEGKINNYIFQGTDSLKFINKTIAWGFENPGFSNGAAYADLDNDGDVDIVINKLNEKASVYENRSNENKNAHYINLSLKAKAPNTFAEGAKVLIKCKGILQSAYITATHGFQSASFGAVHFGTGNNSLIDTIEIIWPNKRTQLLTNVKADQLLSLIQKEEQYDTSLLLPTGNNKENKLFADITASIGLNYKHKENDFIDFNSQLFIPHEISTQGPKVAVADVNLDGLDDFFICGAANQSGELFIQTAGGKFTGTNQSLFSKDSLCEDVNAVFFDANGDGFPDLYVVSGGNQTEGHIPALLDRLYINDGKANFYRSTGLPVFYGNKSVAVAEDVDHDGDPDLFVGGRVVAGNYGNIPDSYILLNDGKGNFTIAGESTATGLGSIGMVTDAVWTDIDNDGWKDLVIVGEWMPVTVYKNDKGILHNITIQLHLQKTTGLWTTIKAADLDNDNFEELLAGNYGENSKLQATETYPLKLYTGDIDVNGTPDQILAVEKHRKYYTFLGKEDLEKQLPGLIKKQFLGYSKMAGLTVEDIFGERLQRMQVLSANTLSSVLIKNNKGILTYAKLPANIQWSPVFTFCTGDFNGDNKRDILSGGNFFGVLPYEGRYDAGGLQVLVNASNTFSSLTQLHYGVQVKGEIRDIKKLRTLRNRDIYIIARNNDSCVFIGLNK